MSTAAQAHEGALVAGFAAVTVASSGEAKPELERGAVAVVVCYDSPPWTRQDAKTLLSLPPALRQGFVVVLLGNGRATGDGWQSFLLPADLLLSAADAMRLGVLRAVVAAKRQLAGLLHEESAARLAG